MVLTVRSGREESGRYGISNGAKVGHCGGVPGTVHPHLPGGKKLRKSGYRPG